MKESCRMNSFDIDKIRMDFSYLDKNKVGKEIIYLDNAATTQRPNQVIKAVVDYYKYCNANPNRGAHHLAVESTKIYEEARKKVANFINSPKSKQVIFTRGTTESINLVAYSYAMENLKQGDEILISILEHHSNLCTWQKVCKVTGAKLKYIYLTKDFQLDMNDFENKLNKNVKLVAITAASNTVATCPNIEYIIKKAKENGSITLIDAAQLVAHKKIDVKNLDCDFLVFSGHKMYSEMGIGVLYAKEDLLDGMQPFHYGGDMVEYVFEQETTYAQLPNKFEAGTQNVAGAVSLMAAINYIEAIGLDNIYKYEMYLTDYAYSKMKCIEGIDIYTTSNKNKSPLILFNFTKVHSHDVSSILDSYNIAIRSGHHCAAPLHNYLNINSSCRASFAFYNTKEEIDTFIESLRKVKEVFKIGY